MNDSDKKPDLLIHMDLGTSDYARIKAQAIPGVELPGKPVAELTKLGWVTMSPGNEIDLNNVMLSRTSIDDCEKLSSLDLLGVKYVYESTENF